MKNRLMTVRQAAEWTGVSKDTLDSWIGPNLIPAMKPGKRWRYVWLFDVLSFLSCSQGRYALECRERLTERAREEEEMGK